MKRCITLMAVFGMVACAGANPITLASKAAGAEGSDVYTDTTLMSVGSGPNGWAYYPGGAGVDTNDYTISGGATNSAAWGTQFTVVLGAANLVDTTSGVNMGAVTTQGGINRDNSGNIGVWDTGGKTYGIDPLEGLVFGIDAGNLDSSLAFQVTQIYVQYLGGSETGVIVNRNDTSKSMTIGAVGTGSDWETNVGAWADVTSLDLIVQGGVSDNELISMYNDGASGNFRVSGFKLDVIPEPATLGLFGLVAGLSLMVRRFRI